MRFSKLSGTDVNANSTSLNAKDAMIGVVRHDTRDDGRRHTDCSMGNTGGGNRTSALDTGRDKEEKCRDQVDQKQTASYSTSG